MSNIIKMKPSNKTKLAQCSLQQYISKRMECPVAKKKTCYFIPLSDIDGLKNNPGRATGTQQSAVNDLMDSLITDPDGQKEPIAVEWIPSKGKFDIVFGCHREWACSEAFSKGFQIANHPTIGQAGIWAWIFSGAPADRTKVQMKENGNKDPYTAGTKIEMVNFLKKYVNQGGLDNGPADRFSDLSDADKYDRAKAFMAKETPKWGKRRFPGVWNILTRNGCATMGLSFTTYGKLKLAQYFANNNPYGIKYSDLKDPDPSGSIVTINGVTYGIYFVNQGNQINGATPTNASKCAVNKNVDHMIVVGALNGSTDANIVQRRRTLEGAAEYWNKLVKKKTFHEVFWMPQTQEEHAKHMVAGTWAGRVKIK